MIKYVSAVLAMAVVFSACSSGNSTTNRSNTRVATTRPANVPPEPSRDKDCSDFNTRAEMLAEFNRYYPHYGDVHWLDFDNDGRPCENRTYVDDTTSTRPTQTTRIVTTTTIDVAEYDYYCTVKPRIALVASLEKAKITRTAEELAVFGPLLEIWWGVVEELCNRMGPERLDEIKLMYPEVTGPEDLRRLYRYANLYAPGLIEPVCLIADTIEEQSLSSLC